MASRKYFPHNPEGADALWLRYLYWIKQTDLDLVDERVREGTFNDAWASASKAVGSTSLVHNMKDVQDFLLCLLLR